MKFSVLLPTRNRLDLLTRAIDTVRRQEYQNWEIIISDNFSEENIATFIESLNDTRIKYNRTDSFIPVTENWNNALDKSTGDYIIMLGDDDCLMQGYFSTLNELITKFNRPDFLYTCAFLYAYPGVLPETPNGFLKTYENRSIFQSAHEPFILENNRALEYVKDSLNFRASFDYNMQFFLVSRKLVDELKHYGPFYQSPYPDYYASNALMLTAKRILIVPQPLVTIGISPKSFGFYYFNDAENDGNQFLNNVNKKLSEKLKNILLPGTEMNTSWLIAMEMVYQNIGNKYNLQVSYKRYRLIQIISVYKDLINRTKTAINNRKLLNKKILIHERITYGIALDIILKITPKFFEGYLAHLLQLISGSHPASPMPIIDGKFESITDVFDKLPPKAISTNDKA